MKTTPRPNVLPGSAGRLSGIDFSSNNFSGQSVGKALRTFKHHIRGQEFTFVKATEGRDYKNPYFHSEWKLLRQRVSNGQMDLRVAYHYLSPGNAESGKAQANKFLNTLGVKGKLAPGTRLALDWEGDALRTPQVLRGAAEQIHKVTGIWPIVYTSSGTMRTAMKMSPRSPKWEANYGANGKGLRNQGGKFLPSRTDTFAQYSNGRPYGRSYDLNVFNGSEQKLRAFAGFKPTQHHFKP
jgi:GH25 family lysozyme M1 (1,4-beta-N-acetylmuramidase)